jgi:hypothetical protein
MTVTDSRGVSRGGKSGGSTGRASANRGKACRCVTGRGMGSHGLEAGRNAVARFGALVAVVCLAVGVVCALTTALAASPATTPSATTVLRVGWTDDPETLNPFVGQTGTANEI